MINQRGFALSLLAIGSVLPGCGGGSDDESSDATTMCYTQAGNTLTVNCTADSLGSCASEGKTALGTYDQWSTCNIDTGSVLQRYSSTGDIAAGPQSREAASAGGGGSGGTGSGVTPADALDYSSSPYSFTCSSGGGKTVDVSNGPCLASEKAFTKAVACNEFGADFTFNHVGKPFYQCLVDNSTGDFKANYQQYLRYYGG